MFTTGAVLLPFFSLMSFFIAISTGVKFFNWTGTMWRGQAEMDRQEARRRAREVALLERVHRLQHGVPGHALARPDGHAPPGRQLPLLPDLATTLNQISTIGAFILGVSNFIFYNICKTWKTGEKVTADDPWGFANSLEWAPRARRRGTTLIPWPGAADQGPA